MTVPYIFASATAPLPLSQLDSNFATAITLGTTSLTLGSTVTSVAGLTLTSATISSLSSALSVGNGGTGLTTLTSGYIPYGNGAGAFSSGNSLVFNGSQLGIGAGVTPTKDITIYKSSTDAEIRLQAGTNNLYLSARNSNGQFDIINSSNSPITFWTNNTEAMRITSTGNVGIGTSSPTAPLSLPDTAGSVGDPNKISLYSSGGVTLYGLGVSGGIQGYIASGAHAFYYRSGTSSTETMRLDTSGNLGLGVTPSVWSNYKAFQFGYSGALSNHASLNYLRLESNSFNGGFGETYLQNGYATKYAQNNAAGIHAWFNAPSGTAGNAITFTQAMTLNNSGQLGIGTTSPSFPLDVVGSGYIAHISNGTSSIGLQADTIVFANANISGYNTGNYDATAHVFKIQNTEYMRLNNSGNLGLGVNPSAFSQSGYLQLGGTKGITTNASGLNIYDNAYLNGAWKYAASNYSSGYYQYLGQHYWLVAPSGTAGNNVSYTQAMTLDNSGNLLVGTTSSINGCSTFQTSGNALTISSTAGSGSSNSLVVQRSTNGNAVIFLNNGSTAGSIVLSGTTTAYNTTSDQRLKTNIIDAPSGNIDQIKVRSFDWKSDNSHVDFGFIAQELVEVAPYAVHQPTNPEEMMAVDYSKLVPMMIREIQDLKARLAKAGL